MLTTGNYLEEFKWDKQGKKQCQLLTRSMIPKHSCKFSCASNRSPFANGGFEPTAKKNHVSPAKPLLRCVSCFHLVLASGKWWSLAYRQEESYSIHKEHADHFHKYRSLLALQKSLKSPSCRKIT
jgi:hypothetical protein